MVISRRGQGGQASRAGRGDRAGGRGGRVPIRCGRRDADRQRGAEEKGRAIRPTGWLQAAVFF